MKPVTGNWQNAALSHAGANIITTSTVCGSKTNCPTPDGLLFNLGNLHEIKKFWNLSDNN